MSFRPDFLNEICDEEGIQIECLSFDYVARLTKGGVTRHIMGAFWDLNSAAADRIACDKAACCTVLERGGVPAIPHELLSNPFLREGFTKTGQDERLNALFGKHGGKIVLKPNQGTKGQDIFLCHSTEEATKAASAIFERHHDAAISPYIDIENEYRVFFLDGNARFTYGKSRVDTWQHNLSQGGVAFEIPDDGLTARLRELATRAASCIGITFASVDIAALPCGGFAVMEINSGIQSKELLAQLPHLRPAIKNIYAEAVRLLFYLNPSPKSRTM